MIVVCDTEYMRACVENGYCRACECSKNYRRVLGRLRSVYVWLTYVNSKMQVDRSFESQLRHAGPKYYCMFRRPVINSLEKIINNMRDCIDTCTSSSLRPNDCPEYFYCDERAIARLYTKGGSPFKNPDIILVASRTFTLIIEEKRRAGSQSRSELVEQLQSSYDMLPEELKGGDGRCVFLALMSERGGLPKGLDYDKRTRFLRRKERGARGALFYPPTLYLHGVPANPDVLLNSSTLKLI